MHLSGALSALLVRAAAAAARNALSALRTSLHGALLTRRGRAQLTDAIRARGAHGATVGALMLLLLSGGALRHRHVRQDPQ